jgi:Immunoglobulin domain
MKKPLIAALLFCLAVISVRADLIWYEPFNYNDGAIITNSSGLWTRHGGTANPSDVLVKNHKVEISATGGATVTRQDDVHRLFPAAYTNSQIVVYASFTINVTNLPNAAGTYVTHFSDNTTSNFLGRVFLLTGTNLCLPNTFRIGIAAANGTVNQIFPKDLALNTDYQVVASYDPLGLVAATLWVNPLSSSDTSVVTGDSVSATLQTKILQAYCFRQAGSFGSCFSTVSNLAVATTFDEAATNVWSTTLQAPVIVYQPQGVTNFVGNPGSMSVVASGQGLTSLIYQWQHFGTNIVNPDGNTNVLNFPVLALTDNGPYTVIVSNSTGGLSATSSAAYVSASNNPNPPAISKQPTNTTVYYGQTATFTVVANGAPPLTYQWSYNGSPIDGATDATLSVVNVNTNNGTTGTYKVVVTNPNGPTPSANAVLSAIGAPAVTIGALRNMVDGTFFLPTNTTALFTATGIVTSFTNLTTTGNSEFIMQDATGGIAVFVAGNGNILPQAGDSVTVTGPLGQFNSLLEMNLSSTNPSHIVVTNSHNNTLPVGAVLPFNFTNSAAYGGISNAIRLYESAVVTFTNVYFPAGFTNGTFASGVNYLMTNLNGDTFIFRSDSRVFDIIGQPIPQFAWSVSGPMSFFLSATATDRSAGYEILPTRYVDIVTTAPAQPVGAVTLTSGKPVVTWVTQPYTSYSILRATNVAGPYVPLASGLVFSGTTGQYTDTNAVPATRFYKIASP